MTNAKQESRIQDILTRYKRLAVVGLSARLSRPSFEVTSYLLAQD